VFSCNQVLLVEEAKQEKQTQSFLERKEKLRMSNWLSRSFLLRLRCVILTRTRGENRRIRENKLKRAFGILEVRALEKNLKVVLEIRPKPKRSGNNEPVRCVCLDGTGRVGSLRSGRWVGGTLRGARSSYGSDDSFKSKAKNGGKNSSVGTELIGEGNQKRSQWGFVIF